MGTGFFFFSQQSDKDVFVSRSARNNARSNVASNSESNVNVNPSEAEDAETAAANTKANNVRSHAGASPIAADASDASNSGSPPHATAAESGATAPPESKLRNALAEDGKLDGASMIPFVPGTIVFLHPLQQSVPSCAEATDTTQCSKPRSQQSQDAVAQDSARCTNNANSKPSPSSDAMACKDAKSEAAEAPGTCGHSSNDDVSQDAAAAEASVAVEVDGGPQCYERLVIDHDAMTLGTIRIHQQGLNDHFLDQYRIGLGMQPLPKST